VDSEHPALRTENARTGRPKNHSRRGDHSSGPSITRKLDAAYPRVHPFEAANRLAGENPSNRFAVLRIFIEPGQLFPPIWPCSTRGLPSSRYCYRDGGLLPHLFTLTCAGAQTGPREVLPLAGRRGAFLTGGLFSVALSVAEAFLLQPPDVIRRVALTVPKRRSPDFPPTRSLRDALRRTDQRSPDSPAANYYKRHLQGEKEERNARRYFISMKRARADARP